MGAVLRQTQALLQSLPYSLLENILLKHTTNQKLCVIEKWFKDFSALGNLCNHLI